MYRLLWRLLQNSQIVALIGRIDRKNAYICTRFIGMGIRIIIAYSVTLFLAIAGKGVSDVSRSDFDYVGMHETEFVMSLSGDYDYSSSALVALNASMINMSSVSCDKSGKGIHSRYMRPSCRSFSEHHNIMTVKTICFKRGIQFLIVLEKLLL